MGIVSYQDEAIKRYEEEVRAFWVTTSLYLCIWTMPILLTLILWRVW
jgi:hypothetical protein